MSRADTFIGKIKEVERYSDFTNNFTVNPLTGNLARVTNEESIKQSIRNLILTNPGEAFYDVNKGSKIRSMLFEIASSKEDEIIKDLIRNTINNYEPRCSIVNISVTDLTEANRLIVTLTFTIRNIPGEFLFDISIVRVA